MAVGVFRRVWPGYHRAVRRVPASAVAPAAPVSVAVQPAVVTASAVAVVAVQAALSFQVQPAAVATSAVPVAPAHGALALEAQPAVVTTSAVAVTVEVAATPEVAPDATLESTGWTIIGGSASHHGAVADESDATLSRSPLNPTAANPIVYEFPPVPDPSSDAGHVLPIRVRKVDVSGAPTQTLHVEWRYDYVSPGSPGTTVQADDLGPVTVALADYMSTLTAPNAASIPSGKYEALQALAYFVQS